MSWEVVNRDGWRGNYRYDGEVTVTKDAAICIPKSTISVIKDKLFVTLLIDKNKKNELAFKFTKEQDAPSSYDIIYNYNENGGQFCCGRAFTKMGINAPKKSYRTQLMKKNDPKLGEIYVIKLK